MGVGDSGPDLGHDVGREAAALGERGEKGLEVAGALVAGEEQEDLLLGGHVLVEVGARPAQLVGDRGEGDLMIGVRLELAAGGPLDLLEALPLLLGAARPYEIGHGTLRVSPSA